MRNFLTKVIGTLLLTSTIPLAAFAGGSFVGNGGGTVACFRDSNPRNVEDGLVTSHGVPAMTSIVSLEYYLASSMRQMSPELDQMIRGDQQEQLLRFLWARIGADPAFELRLKEAWHSLNFYPSSLQKERDSALHDTHDWSSPVTLPTNCQRIQSATRRGWLVQIDPLIWNKLSVPQQTLLLFHESLYYAGEKSSGQRSSRPTQDLLTYLLSRQFTPAGFRSRIRTLGF